MSSISGDVTIRLPSPGTSSRVLQDEEARTRHLFTLETNFILLLHSLCLNMSVFICCGYVEFGILNFDD